MSYVRTVVVTAVEESLGPLIEATSAAAKSSLVGACAVVSVASTSDHCVIVISSRHVVAGMGREISNRI